MLKNAWTLQHSNACCFSTLLFFYIGLQVFWRRKKFLLLVPILSIYLKTEKQGFLKRGKINIKSCVAAALWHSGLNCQWQHAIPAPVHVLATSLRIQLPANATGRAADVPSTWVSAFQVGYGMKLSALTWHSPAPAAIRGSKPEDGRNLSLCASLSP